MKINVKAFVADFAAGMPPADLQAKHMLSAAQVDQLVQALQKRGDIKPEDVERRQTILGQVDISEDRPSQPETTVRVDLDTGLVLHCPSCGAAVKRDAEHCQYCNSALDFSLTGKIIHCPHCFERIPADSRFCFRCARPVKASEQTGDVQKDRLCPRCHEPMIGQTIGDFHLTGCEKCGGLFVLHETFEMMQDTSQRLIETGAISKPVPIPIGTKFAYARCPVCGTMMNRKNFAHVSGVIVDVCGYHGTWFDRGELEKIMDFIARGGLQKARAKEEERLRDLEVLERLRLEDSIDKGTSASFFMDRSTDPGLLDVLSKAFTLLTDR